MKRFKYLTLAALVAFAACDEGDDDVVAPPVTGTISGVVTIEGTAASGVSVALSSGQTATTDASGSYSFTGVSAGAYTVSISGLPSDATFSSTSKAATISSAGQVVTVNFDGSFVRTSAILGSVAAGGSALEGVTVSIGGGNTTTTDSNGQYAFTGLRAGEYTVSISGFDANQFTFPSTSQTTTLGVGESKSVSFSGQFVSTASISGSLYLDENDKDDVFTSQTEDKLPAAGVQVTILDGTIPVFDTTTTDANGDFSFTGLPKGFYTVEIDPADSNIPGNVAFGGTSTAINVDLNAGESESVFWPFDITQQAITAAVFYGTDGVDPGINPLSGVTLNLYAQESHAVAGTPILASDTTKLDGTVTFRFARTADTSPAGGRDNILFVELPGPLPADHALNGEQRIEITYASKDSLSAAQDTFDVLTRRVLIQLRAEDGNENPLGGWSTSWWKNDTTAARIALGTTAPDGLDTLNLITSFNTLPDTFFTRLSGPQPLAGGLTFTQAATAGRDGTAASSQTLMVVHDGTQPLTDPLRAGTSTVTYTQMNLLARVHNEADDSTDSPVFTGGDGFAGTPQIEFEVFDEDGVSVAGPTSPGVGSSGIVTFAALPLGDYEVRARSLNPNVDLLDDSVATTTLTGLAQADSLDQLAGNAGFSTFAHKFGNVALRGTVKSVDGVTPVPGLRVRIQPTADNIQPDVTDTTVFTGPGGVYRLEGIREGPYTITAQDSTTTDGPVWSFFDTLETGSAPLSSGSDDNDSETMATRDVEGSGGQQFSNFQAERMDTKIAGVVVNDRDGDFNTLDPNEALPGVTIELFEDDGDGTFDEDDDTVLETTTTDGTGGYEFDFLREGSSYFVRAVQPANATVLRALSGAGAVTDVTPLLSTTAAAGAGATLNQNGTRQVGTTDPVAQDDELPRWSYTTTAASADAGNLGAGGGPNFANVGSGALTTTPAHFIHLFNTGVVRGTLVDGAGDPAADVRVTVTLCAAASSAPPSPVGRGAGFCTVHTPPSPNIVNADTDANGDFEVTGLLEGVYQVTVAPATGGFTTNIGPDGVGTSGDEIMLLTIQGDGDVETVPDYEVN